MGMSMKQRSKIQALSILIGLSVFALAGSAFADSISGKCVTKSGNKCSGGHTISTSWNSKKAFPSNGRYKLDFGKKVGKRVTVYCDGKKVGSVSVSGSTTFDVRCR